MVKLTASTDPLAVAVSVATGGEEVVAALRVWLARGLIENRHTGLEGASIDPRDRLRIAEVFEDVAIDRDESRFDEDTGEARLTPGALAALLADEGPRHPLSKRSPRSESAGTVEQVVLIGGPGQGKCVASPERRIPPWFIDSLSPLEPEMTVGVGGLSASAMKTVLRDVPVTFAQVRNLLDVSDAIDTKLLESLVGEFPDHLVLDPSFWYENPTSQMLDPEHWKSLGLPAPSPPEPSGLLFDRVEQVVRFEVTDLRLFERLAFELPEKRWYEFHWPESGTPVAPWLVLLGENSVGKTTLLRALALALVDPADATAMLTDSRSPWRREDGRDATVTVNLPRQTYTVTITRGETERETPETFDLWERHYRALREGLKAGDPSLHELERQLAKRLGTYATTSVDRIAIDVATRVMDEMVKQHQAKGPADLTPEQRSVVFGRVLAFVREETAKAEADPPKGDG